MDDDAAVRTRVWRDGVLETDDARLEQVSDYLAQGDCLVWVDLLRPGEQTLGALADELSLDQHAIEDAVGVHERPKATRYASHLFLTSYVLGYDEGTGSLRVGRVSAFSTHHYFVTVRLDDALDINAVVARWDDNADLICHGARVLAYGLLDEIVDGYFTAVEALDERIERIEDILFDENPRSARQVSRTTFELRRSLAQARRAILPMREVVNTVMRRATSDDVAPELTPYYEDLYDHVLRAAEWAESLRDMITSIFETNMSLADTRMNQIMKKLTGWAAIIAVPTAITGYFGQNVPYPGAEQHWGFWLSTIAILLVAFALYAVFRRKDWL